MSDGKDRYDTESVEYISFIHFSRCHGQAGNVVYELAVQHDLLAANDLSEAGIQMRRSNGAVVTPERGAALRAHLGDLLEVSDADAEAAAAANRSLGDVVLLGFPAALAQLKEDEAVVTDAEADVEELAGEFVEALHRYNNGMEASDTWFDVGMRDYAAYREALGDQMLSWKGRGYGTVFDLLMVSCFWFCLSVFLVRGFRQ